MRRREFLKLTAGAAAIWPLAVHAQPVERIHRIGVLMSTAENERDEKASVGAFIEGLKDRGWMEGSNLVVDYRWAAGDPQRMREYARELVLLAPDVIFAKGASVSALLDTTSTIPIVFVVLSDAVAQGYVPNFARPLGNVTGFTSNEIALVGKRLALLKEISPHLSRVLYVRGVRPETRALFLRAVEDGSRLGLTVVDCAASNDADIERAVTSFAQKPNGGLSVAFDAFNTVHRSTIVELATRYYLPAAYSLRLFAEDGGMLSYGFNQIEQFKQAATYVDRILKGEKVGDLPVQLPTKFELVINLKTTKAIGLTVPSSLLATADEVIE
jgi:putative tryptophan/tyrosine transport system substrate-binding protein